MRSIPSGFMLGLSLLVLTAAHGQAAMSEAIDLGAPCRTNPLGVPCASQAAQANYYDGNYSVNGGFNPLLFPPPAAAWTLSSTLGEPASGFVCVSCGATGTDRPGFTVSSDFGSCPPARIPADFSSAASIAC